MNQLTSIDTILERMNSFGGMPAIIANDCEHSYFDLINSIDRWTARLDKDGVRDGTVCGFIGDYGLEVTGLIFALMKARAILVPFTPAIQQEISSYKAIAGVQCLYTFTSDSSWRFEKYENVPGNDMIVQFRTELRPGLVVFSSGSTGKPKGILQDCERVMKKFVTIRKGWRTILFLMLDHFGGFNTLLSCFAYGGTAVCLSGRTPDEVCKAIQLSRANLLPTTPTFINLLLATSGYQQYDLSSIELITYGTEVMPRATLEKLNAYFPKATVKQTYGLSELGVLRSKSEGDSSVWVKIGGDGFEVKIINNILWVRSDSNMIGYLNFPQPFDSEGWMCTGDEVETNGEYVRIIGRKSDLINVGGQKVFPAEVEGILLKAENVQEATVVGSPHPLMGQIVVAKVSLINPEDPDTVTGRLRKHCIDHLAKFKVPVRFIFVTAEEQRNDRFKKSRTLDSKTGAENNNANS